MKKKYVRPESRLFVINLNEDIALSGDENTAPGVQYVLTGDGLTGYISGNPLCPFDPKSFINSDLSATIAFASYVQKYPELYNSCYI